MVCCGMSIGESSSSMFFQLSHTPSRRSPPQGGPGSLLGPLPIGVDEPLHFVE
jgi:hypothetical protein